MPSKVHGCNVCEKVFPSGQALGGHMRSHFNAQCKLCGKVFRSLKALYGHMRCHSSPPSDEKLRMEEAAECLLLLSGGHWVEDHHPSADSEATPVSADSEAEEKKKKRLYTCTTCGRTFSSFQALGGHRAYHNKAEKDHPMEELSPSTVMPSKVHGCNVCEKVFPSGQALGGHMRSHFNAHAQSKREKEKEPCQAVPITGLFDLNLPAVPEF
ncbi:Zinc finger protein ZAT5 [Acorus gramineus]|uniref:Zinc finger protein ZAT5 n=1 Tax=Acorus gramineus TaxID=55184 RepID=A0AAV9BBN3_ACOGR|nr:Zinc finger protein ZAT5 [Acorus gramineus]